MNDILKGLTKSEEERALELHKKSTVIDGLALRFYLEDPHYHRGLVKSGVTAGNVTVAGYYEFGRYVAEFSSSLKTVNAMIDCVNANKDKALLVTSVKDIERAKREGRFGVILGFQDTKPIYNLEGETYFLNIFYNLGTRIIQLTENDQNMVGTGCCERVDGGLTWLGLEILEKLNDFGVVVDLSHCGDATTMEAIERSKDPVLFTHCNARSLCSSKRNKTDEQIRALAEKGGVIGVTPYSPLLRMTQSREGRPTLDDLMKHVDYLVDLVGIDHIGFGWDVVEKGYDEGKESMLLGVWRTRRPDVYGEDKPATAEFPPTVGIERYENVPNFTKALVAKGYSDQEITKILGGNFLRVFKRVWK